MIDYLIVGQGLSGSCLASKFLEENKSFKVINIFGDSASYVSSGMYNPVVLKRFTPVWNAQEEIDNLLKYFKEQEELLKVKLVYPSNLFRILSNQQEVKTWKKKASTNPRLIPFLDENIYSEVNPYIKAEFGLGRVKQSGKIFVREYLREFRKYLLNKELLIEDIFDFNSLDIKTDYISYKGIEAKRLVFCDGFGLTTNPFFNNLPMQGLKGETMVILANGLNLKDIVKAKVFIMPMEKDFYYVGATYDYDNIDEQITEDGQKELKDKLNLFLDIDYKIIKQFAGIRPTVIDRRPLLGRHNQKKNLFIFNGLGTRGVMLAPTMATAMFNFLEKGDNLLEEININRFN